MHKFTLILIISLLNLGHPQALRGYAVAEAPSFGSGITTCAAPVLPVVLTSPTVVTDCTRAGLQAALNQGGQITFDCGPAQFTLPIGVTLELNPAVDTVIDGGGLVTLDGLSQVRILHKDWHNPALGPVTITLQNIRLVNGKAPSGSGTGDHSGGALAAGYSATRVHIINATFENNSTRETAIPDNQGGAIFVHNAAETVISGSVFSGNLAGNGGAFGGIATGLVIANSRFTANQAVDASPGGIVRGYGGAIHLDGVNPDLPFDLAQGQSGVARNNNRVSVCGSVFEDNVAQRGGGALSVVISDAKGTKATYEKSTFTGNRVLGVDGSFGQGGAIYHIEDDHAGGDAEDNLEIGYNAFHANQALRQGGAAWLYILGRGRVVNTTFEGNSTSAPFNTVGQGGALVITLGKIDIVNTVFANNHAAYQAGALHGGGDGDPQRVITLSNTIFLNNTLNEQDLPSETKWQGYHTNRPMLNGGQNIQHPRFKPTYNNEVNNNITPQPIYTDPMLAALGDNGGPTLTMALLPDSPAINQGNPLTCLDDDQRGFVRNDPCDIGPYEYDGTAVSLDHLLWLPVAYK